MCLFAFICVGAVTYAEENGGNYTVISDILNATNSNSTGNTSVTPFTDNSSSHNDSIVCNTTITSADESSTVSDNNETSVENNTSSQNATNTTNPEIPKSGLIKITAIHVTNNKLTEYANITNNGCYAVDLNGWKVETGCGVIFPLDGAIIKSGETLTIHSDAGTNTENDYYLNAKTHIWEKGSGNAKLYYEDIFKI